MKKIIILILIIMFYLNLLYASKNIIKPSIGLGTSVGFFVGELSEKFYNSSSISIFSFHFSIDSYFIPITRIGVEYIFFYGYQDEDSMIYRNRLEFNLFNFFLRPSYLMSEHHNTEIFAKLGLGLAYETLEKPGRGERFHNTDPTYRIGAGINTSITGNLKINLESNYIFIFQKSHDDAKYNAHLINIDVYFSYQFEENFCFF